MQKYPHTSANKSMPSQCFGLKMLDPRQEDVEGMHDVLHGPPLLGEHIGST